MRVGHPKKTAVGARPSGAGVQLQQEGPDGPLPQEVGSAAQRLVLVALPDLETEDGLGQGPVEGHHGDLAAARCVGGGHRPGTEQGGKLIFPSLGGWATVFLEVACVYRVTFSFQFHFWKPSCLSLFVCTPPPPRPKLTALGPTSEYRN